MDGIFRPSCLVPGVLQVGFELFVGEHQLISAIALAFNTQVRDDPVDHPGQSEGHDSQVSYDENVHDTAANTSSDEEE